jgi:hypothetical protein
MTRHWLEDYRAPDGSGPVTATSRAPNPRPVRSPRVPRPRQTQPFICGPIPVAWVARLRAPTSGGAQAGQTAAWLVWYVAGLHGRHIDLPISARRYAARFGVSDRTVRRGLDWLARQELITVRRRPRGTVWVSVIPVEDSPTPTPPPDGRVPGAP